MNYLRLNLFQDQPVKKLNNSHSSYKLRQLLSFIKDHFALESDKYFDNKENGFVLAFDQFVFRCLTD